MGIYQPTVPDLPLPYTITQRSATEQDEPFLYRLYKLSRVEEFLITGISESHFDILMKMQYLARKAAYESNYPDARRKIVIANGNDVGQLWFLINATQYRVIDIIIADEFRNHGIGAWLMKDLIEQAKQAGVPLRCSVATNNPGSLRFHRRLGFGIISSDDAYYQMEI